MQVRHFDKNVTNFCKGIAISIVVYFHLFGNADIDSYTAVIPFVRNILASYGNGRVFFVLLTGYGFGVQSLNKDVSYSKRILPRLCKLYRSYWIVYACMFALFPIMTLGANSLTAVYGTNPGEFVQHLVLDFLGLTHLVYGFCSYTLNQTWWYISLALVLILLLPLLCCCWDKWRWKSFVVVLLLAVMLPDVKYIEYIPAATLGVCLAGCNGFEKVNQKGNNILGVFVRVLILGVILAIWYQMRQNEWYPVLVDTLVAWAGCQFAFDVLSCIPVLRQVVCWVGKHSANIFYVHSFVCYYWPRTYQLVHIIPVDLVIWIMTMALSIVISILVELLKSRTGYLALFEWGKTPKQDRCNENGSTKKRGGVIWGVIAVCFLSMTWIYSSQASWALTLKKQIKYEVLHIPHDTQEAETVGMDDDWEMTLYADGEVTSDVYYNADLDNKRVYAGESRSRLVNYTDGYQMDFPADTTFDFSLSAAVIHAAGEGYEYTISREYSPYFDITEEMTTGLQKYVPDFPYEDGVDQYIGYYQSRFLLNETWQKNNSVTVSDVEVFSAGGAKAYCYHAVMEDVPGDKYDAYSYYYIRAEDRDFFRIVVKYHHENTELRQWIRDSFESFRQFTPAGSSHISTNYEPVIPDNWSDETRAVYDSIVSGETLRWGIYTDDVYGNGIDVKIPELEETLDYKFQVVLSYVHSISQFPTEFMEKNWEQGRIVELTYQLTENNNEDMFGYSPLLDLYRGINEEMIREFARAAKDFGHPFLFRFCNEMNSDWTSYGGVVNMADPELFVECYQRIYRIFQEEGVDNCIWIYNPNDRNAPPSRWNDALNYYPGNEYVQMIGVTGYNNGTYYRKWAESWREFAEIYDTLQNEYGQVFGAFPWIITEFSSSSVGGDKVSWIEDMFANIGNYPNIKIAVWFSSADYDQDGTVARPYWLDETPATLEAFQQGLQQYPVIPWEDS